MLRYANSVAEAVRLAAQMHTGAGVVLTSPGEQGAVAEAIRAASAFEGAALSDVTALHHEPFRKIVADLGARGADRTAQLELLNSRRGWFSTHDQRVILVVDLQEMLDLQRHAADLFSARPFFAKVPFVPDANVHVATARRELAGNLADRVGKLDMRGLIRRESQDVAFSIEELYQALTARRLFVHERGAANLESDTTISAAFLMEQEVRPLVDWMVEARNSPHRTAVILGGPGSGKTFFLRWMALRALREDSLFGIDQPLPLLVSIAAFARAPEPVSLREHIVDELLRAGQKAAHVAEGALRAGTAIVLLDGLDEVPGGGHRARVLEELTLLRAAFPACLFVITSRPAGYPGLSAVDHLELQIEPFGDDQIRGFLQAWSLLYARERLGAGEAAAKAGKEEGERLVSEVLSNPGVKGLAQTPLLLTVIAVVHRTGVRLPDHRVELYDQITQVLVERWNRLRGLSAEQGAAPPPLKAVDAVRLLGPLALRMVASGVQSNITEETLRKELAGVLETGTLRGVATVDEAVELFRDTLGLLVEVGPGLFGFLHLTLVEYFAAWELVRSDALEKLVADSKQTFAPQTRELVLLAVGVLGLLRGDDQRLQAVIEKIAQGADTWVGEPTEHVPALLGELLCDDANLGKKQIERLVNSLVPGWWLQRFDEAMLATKPGGSDLLTSIIEVLERSISIAQRARPETTRLAIRERLENCYGPGGNGPFPSNFSVASFAVYLLTFWSVDAWSLIQKFFAVPRQTQVLLVPQQPHFHQWDRATLVGQVVLPKSFLARVADTSRSVDFQLLCETEGTGTKRSEVIPLRIEDFKVSSASAVGEEVAFTVPFRGLPGEEIKGLSLELCARRLVDPSVQNPVDASGSPPPRTA